MAFSTLLYRYFFFSWLFRDASRGNQFERMAAWRHNQEQARWLPTYMRRWLGFGLLLCGLGAIVEMGFGGRVVSCLLYVPGVLSLPVNAVIVAAWAGLKLLSSPA
jgi:hypothetical protein